MDAFDIIVRYREAFYQGLLVTLQLAGVTWGVGLTLGWAIGASAHRWPTYVGYPLRFSAFFLSGVPFLVLLYWAHYPLQELLGVVINPFVTASAVLSIINTVIVAEVWRTAFDGFRKEFLLAARVCGLNSVQSLRYIEAPLVLRQVLPTLLAVQVTMLQMTLFASLISVEELFRVAQRINSTIYRPVEIYTALALFFLAICMPPYFAAYWMRRRFTRDFSEQ